MSEQLIATVRADSSQYEEAMKRVGEEPSRAASRAKSGFSALNKFMEQTQKRADVLKRMKIAPVVQLIDRISGPAKKIESTLSRLGGSVKKITIEAVDKATSVVKRIVSTLTSPLALIGGGAGATASIVFPLKLAGEKEQAQMAFNFMAESAERGKQLMNEILAFAAQTPYEFDFLRETTSSLMGVYKDMFPDVEARIAQAKRTFTAFGDAAGRTGASMDQVKLSMMGFKQIAMIGTLQMEELRQVSENLGVPMSIILKELGLTNSELKDLGSLGIPASQAMEAILRAFEKNYSGGLKELSRSYFGMASTLKDTGKLIVTSFGEGMAGPVKDILSDLIGEFDYTSDKYKAFQGKVEGVGKRVGESFKSFYESSKTWINKLNEDETFKSLDLGGKFIYIINAGLGSVNTWLDGPGGKQVETMFTKLGEIAGRAWLAGLKGTFTTTIKEAGKGNIFGALAFGGLFSLLGGGLLLRGAWGLGKGLFGAGKQVAGRVGIGGAAGVAAEGAFSAAKVGEGLSWGSKAISSLGKAAKVAGKVAIPLAVATELYDISRSENKAAAAVKSLGGLGGGVLGAKVGAAIGTAILPGVGTAIGGVLGGIGGYLFGKKVTGNFAKSAQPDKGAVITSVPTAETASILASFNVNLQSRATDIIAKMGFWEEQTWKITAISTAFAVNLQYVADRIVANGSFLAVALAGAAARAASFALQVTPVPAVAHASGGIFNRPHFGLLAEEGAEAYIPLSSRMRTKAIDLYRQVGNYLGVYQVPAATGGNINLDVRPNINIALGGSDIDFDALAVEVGWRIVGPIKKALENRG